MTAVRHSLIIRHPSRALILLVRQEGAYTLPTVVTEDRHSAEVDHINAAVRETFGITTTFLRSLFHDASADADPVDRCHELSARGADVPCAGSEWCEPHRLPAGLALPGTHVPRDGRDWERATWWDDATAWIRETLGAKGVSVTDIVQLRAWPSSSVLRIRAAAGDFYFKAVADSIRRECAVTAYLAKHFPGAVPALVAIDLDRRWLLMDAVRGQKLEDIATMARWEEAARLYGQLQVASRDHTEALRACGASERTVAQLAHGLDALAEEHEAVRRLLPALRTDCARLAAYGIPSLLEHGDLWPGNFLVGESGSVLIDWEDAAIGHPFFSVAPFLVGLQTYQPALATAAATERVLAAYLEAFAPFADAARLRAALDHALPLAFCDMALRYQQQPPSVVRLHPWMRDLVPEAVRRMLGSRSGEVKPQMATDGHG